MPAATPPSPRILVCYYSMTGNTRRLAEELQHATGATLEEITEPRPRRGLPGVLRALFDALTRRQPPLLPGRTDPATVDLLLLGGPVWAQRLASPVRAYAARSAGRARQVAFFCTEGGKGAEAGFADLEALCGHARIASLVVDAQHLERAAHADALRDFVAQLGLAGAPSVPAPAVAAA
jgi:flavodoxin